MSLEIPPMRYVETVEFMRGKLLPDMRDVEEATCAAIGTDVALWLATLGFDGECRSKIIIGLLMTDIAIAVNRNDPAVGVVIEFDGQRFRLTISSDRDKLDDASRGRDSRLCHACIPFLVRNWIISEGIDHKRTLN